MDAERQRTRLLAALLTVAMAANAPAQHPPGAPKAADRNGGAKAATHAPKPRLKPLIAWEFIKLCNAEYVQQLAEKRKRKQPAEHGSEHGAQHADDAGHQEPGHHGSGHHGSGHHGSGKHKAGHHQPTPRPVRPSGAGRYVCAVLACADQAVELAPVLGLQRKDVLILRTPGPFVSPEAVALLERAVERHRLSLVLVLGHRDCDSLRQPKDREDALTRRLVALRRLARRGGRSLHEALVHQQRELLLASSSPLARAVDRDHLRVVPALLDARTGTIQWVPRRAHTLPIAPVK